MDNSAARNERSRDAFATTRKPPCGTPPQPTQSPCPRTGLAPAAALRVVAAAAAAAEHSAEEPAAAAVAAALLAAGRRARRRVVVVVVVVARVDADVLREVGDEGEVRDRVLVDRAERVVPMYT